MANCKCGKVLLDGEKKCERCKKKGREKINKILIVPSAVGAVGALGLGIKKCGLTVVKPLLKK